MAMDAGEIERLIKAGIPDAEVTIRDLAGDGCYLPVRHARGLSLVDKRVRHLLVAQSACLCSSPYQSVHHGRYVIAGARKRA